MASRKEYEMLFQLNAQLGSSHTSTFKMRKARLLHAERDRGPQQDTPDISAYQKQ